MYVCLQLSHVYSMYSVDATYTTFTFGTSTLYVIHSFYHNI